MVREVIHKCRNDRTTGHTVVKRFKRQYCVPLTSDPTADEEVPFDQLPYYDWADSATNNIGEFAIKSIRTALWRQVEAIRRGFIQFDTSVDAIRARHEEGKFDLELSTGIFLLMTQHFDGITEETWNQAVEMYLEGAGTIVQYINIVYIDSELLPMLKDRFSKPPKRLDYFGNLYFRLQTRHAGEFVGWLLSHAKLFGIEGEFQLALTKMMVDIDAIHKQEILPSLVKFPGNNAEIMPGSFPLQDSIIEEVPVGTFTIEPVYECKHPDSRPPTSGSGSGSKSGLEAATQSTPQLKGVLKKEPKNWPVDPTSPEISDMEAMMAKRTYKLQFQSPVAFFTPPQRSPRRQAGRPVKLSPAKRTPTKAAPVVVGSPAARSPIRKTAGTVKSPTSDYTRWVLDLYRTPKVDLSDQGTGYATFLEKARQELYSQRELPPSVLLPPQQPAAEAALQKPREPMGPEERRREIDLFLRDLETGPNGQIQKRKPLLPESSLAISMRMREEMAAVRQLRSEMVEGAARQKREKERERLEQEEALRRAEEAKAAKERALASQRLLRGPRHPVVEPISDEWETKIEKISSADPSQTLATTPDGQALTKRDFLEKLLPPTAWLNDNVITGSILHVGQYVNSKAGATVQDPACAAFTSYFWPRLESAGPAQCGRLMRRAGVKKDNFLSLGSVLIPICSGSHWTLAAVLPNKRIVTHMDSLRGGRGNPAVTAKLLEWVKVTLGELFVADEWKARDLRAPRQENGWDCGVFTITNALCLGLGLDPDESYAADELTLQRRRLAAMLLNGGFKGDFDLGGL